MIRPYDLLRVLDTDSQETYWIFYKQGEFSKPIQVFTDQEIKTITETYNKKHGLLLRRTTTDINEEPEIHPDYEERDY